jgi:DNA-binding NtrC family response regulator
MDRRYVRDKSIEFYVNWIEFILKRKIYPDRIRNFRISNFGSGWSGLGRAEMEKGKILLVDDEDVFANNIAKLIARRGHEIETVQNGENALAALTRTEFDVIVLDSNIPGMNSPAMVKEIKEMSPKVEVIILTGHSLFEGWGGEIELGAYEIMMKPVRFEDLFEKIKQACQKKRHLNK